MGDVEEGLFALLTGTAAVGAIVGDKVYPIEVPQGARPPWVVYFRVSGPRVRSLDGPSGLAQPRFQVECQGATADQARGLANAVRRALDGYRGTVTTTASPADTVRIGGISLLSDQDGFEDATGPGRRSFRRILDFLVTHEEE